jgi:hypothetical protein
MSQKREELWFIITMYPPSIQASGLKIMKTEISSKAMMSVPCLSNPSNFHAAKLLTYTLATLYGHDDVTVMTAEEVRY